MQLHEIRAIDSHIHCGIQNSTLPVEKIMPLLREAHIEAACMFSPVEDIYDRHDYSFLDNALWRECRQKANDYVLDLKERHAVYPYYFVWNDFKTTCLDKGYKGVKWHRHADEPTYDYETPQCEEFLNKIYALGLPIVLEEEYHNTVYLIDRINGRTPVIIPHLGILNGGYAKIKAGGLWERPAVYADTALAYSQEIKDYVENFGSKRLLFGSDFPFGSPKNEKRKILELPFEISIKEEILYNNIIRLIRI